MTDAVLTLQEVADELGVHYMTAYRYVKLGLLYAEKRGGSWMITTDDLAAFQSRTRGDAHSPVLTGGLDVPGLHVSGSLEDCFGSACTA